MADKILIRGLRFYGHHGVSVEEQETGQWYSVDLDIFVDLRRAGKSDDLSASVDYGEVCQRVLRLGVERSFRLIEALAEAIADMVLEAFPIEGVRVKVIKTPPPDLSCALSRWGFLEHFAVEIIRASKPRKDIS